MKNIATRDRLILAMDVQTSDEARRLADELDGVVSFYKVGLLLLMAGGMETLLKDLISRGKVFLDLKLPNDIKETVRSTIELGARMGVEFVTLSNSVTPPTVQAAREGRGESATPRFLFVPLVSSMNQEDLALTPGAQGMSLEEFIAVRSSEALEAGCDGLIASGDAIGMLRRQHPETVIVSPGIRPSGFGSDDHKRLTTPADAIKAGADHLVVGRPIRKPPQGKSRRDVASAILSEIDQAVHAARL